MRAAGTTDRGGTKWRAADGRKPSGYLAPKDAEDQLAQILAAAPRQRLTPLERHTFGEACEEYLRYVEFDRERRPSTVSDYRNTMRKHLIPHFGETRPVRFITTDDIDAYREELLFEPRSLAAHGSEDPRDPLQHPQAGQAQEVDPVQPRRGRRAHHPQALRRLQRPLRRRGPRRRRGRRRRAWTPPSSSPPPSPACASASCARCAGTTSTSSASASSCARASPAGRRARRSPARSAPSR